MNVDKLNYLFIFFFLSKVNVVIVVCVVVEFVVFLIEIFYYLISLWYLLVLCELSRFFGNECIIFVENELIIN